MNRFIPKLCAAACCAALLLASGCTMLGEGGAKSQLSKALEAHAESVRWGGMRGLENNTGSRITDFEVRSVKFDNPDYTRAIVRVEVQGYAYPKMALQRWFVEQTWEERSDNWMVVAEKEIKAPRAKVGRSTLGTAELGNEKGAGSGAAR